MLIPEMQPRDGMPHRKVRDRKGPAKCHSVWLLRRARKAEDERKKIIFGRNAFQYIRMLNLYGEIGRKTSIAHQIERRLHPEAMRPTRRTHSKRLLKSSACWLWERS